jgi:hypothetical protein
MIGLSHRFVGAAAGCDLLIFMPDKKMPRRFHGGAFSLR